MFCAILRIIQPTHMLLLAIHHTCLPFAMAYSAWLFRLWYTYIGYAELIVHMPGKSSAAECLFLLLQACCCHLSGPRSACTTGHAQRKRCIRHVSQAAENVLNTVALRPRFVITFGSMDLQLS